MGLENKKDSIYFQLLRLLVFSAVCGIMFFIVLNTGGNYLIENYYFNSDYEAKKDEEYLKKLQVYINENNLSSRNTAELNKWVKKQKIIVLRVYMNNKQVFDSDYPDQELWEEDIESREYDWETYYSVDFSDGTATVGLFGLYEYQLYNYAFFCEVILSFFLFIILVLLGIRKKMRYILKLSDEIAILEGGSLDYPITVKGQDELTILAEGLENMRLSFQNMIEQETEMVNENNKIITEMSHDLRTPVTSVLLYTEIMKKEGCKDEKRSMEYIEKIDKKARRLKQLTDHLFEYALVSGGKDIELEEPEPCEVVFYDLFSETCSYLIQNGFNVDFEVKWHQKNIQVYTEYIVRILDNISSNLIKYSDPEHVIKIYSIEKENMTGFGFENTVLDMEEKKDSNGVGIPSVKNMMKKMKGKCNTTQKNNIFKIELLFPVINC